MLKIIGEKFRYLIILILNHTKKDILIYVYGGSMPRELLGYEQSKECNELKIISFFNQHFYE